MRIGHSQHDYDRESDYWQDIEDAQNMQIEAQKSSIKNDCIFSSKNEIRDKSESLINGGE